MVEGGGEEVGEFSEGGLFLFQVSLISSRVFHYMPVGCVIFLIRLQRRKEGLWVLNILLGDRSFPGREGSICAWVGKRACGCEGDGG